ncbi:MAG: DoxX family protein [Candidatus Acidiferrales bacterium]
MSGLTTRITGWNDIFVKIASSLQSAFLLVIRVYWGWQFAQTGWGKLHSLPHVVEFFSSLGIPAPGVTAVFVSVFELVAGILLALGFVSRITALGIVTDMTVAYITADREALASAFSSDATKFINASPFIFWAVALVVLFFGPGKYALDTLLAKKFRKTSG